MLAKAKPELVMRDKEIPTVTGVIIDMTRTREIERARFPSAL